MNGEATTDNAPPDLSICDREPITRLERIQPFGFLLAMSSDWVVVWASDNLQRHLGLNAAAVIGTKLDALIDPKILARHPQSNAHPVPHTRSGAHFRNSADWLIVRYSMFSVHQSALCSYWRVSPVARAVRSMRPRWCAERWRA